MEELKNPEREEAEGKREISIIETKKICNFLDFLTRETENMGKARERRVSVKDATRI